MAKVTWLEILFCFQTVLAHSIRGLMGVRNHLPGMADRTSLVDLPSTMAVQTNRHPGSDIFVIHLFASQAVGPLFGLILGGNAAFNYPSVGYPGMAVDTMNPVSQVTLVRNYRI